MRALILAVAALPFLAGGIALAQGAEVRSLAVAKAQSEAAQRKSEQFQRRAEAATDAAARARASASAVAARIEAAEADVTAAETRVRIVEEMRAGQRARLAERQAPLVRLIAALQMLGRRPPALALVQPGSVADVVHVRSVLASTLPIVEARTAGMRAEIARSNRLSRDAETAASALVAGRRELQAQRVAFARLERSQRARADVLAESALSESDRALSFDEEARDLAALADRRDHQAAVQQRLLALAEPVPRPGPVQRASRLAAPAYRLPVEGRILRGTGEISDGGIHARGLTFATAPAAGVFAPSAGRIVYAGRFRDYDGTVIIDHGGGWTTTITDLGTLAVNAGDTVRPGDALGAARRSDPRISVELRQEGRPFPIAPLLSGG
ncbi:murein hydrolase activator EnvC family protein [Allosphingosinicella indica]|uniref:Septal ring factor EnvC, activator of murein hydrolases AmiA and AmiB n=1 Tax=Allosphingosinicella indica TaxID=941907 RepID=A0A1X7GU99_9SPHN|nr:peptidoglycan DD-metalloendopeptidase family protein [Allosphingosinicella indica]SMF74080.1 Septal ring factor EnvC, activator of murein hydrolases AmiA and AmiB [Allosphingosinicella indica]